MNDAQRPCDRHPGTAQRRRLRGFSMIELLIAMGIGALLVGMGIPAMKSMVVNQRIKAASTDLYTSLMRTRSEALKRNTSVTMSPVTSSNWADGWRIANPSGTPTYLEEHSSLSALTITGPSNVVFRSSGRVVGSTAPQFDISATGSDLRRCVTVDLSGRPYVKSAAC